MRGKLILMLVGGAVLTVGVAGIAIARQTPYVSTCLQSMIAEASDCQGFPSLVAEFGGEVVPEGLPKHEMAPVAVKLRGKVSTSDGTHPSALREVTIDFDRNVAISAKGLPVCHPSVEVPIRKACGSSIVGGGKVDFALAFPEDPPIRVPSELTAYNAGVKAGVTVLYVSAFVPVPRPNVIVTRVEIRRIHEGRYGLRAVAKIPVIAGGSGSLLDFSLRLKRHFEYRGAQRDFAMARCPDGHLDAEISTLFENEAKTPGVPPTTVTKGALVLPCTPTG